MARGRSPYDDDDDDIDESAPWLSEGVREPRPSTMVPRGRLVGGALVFLALLVLVGLGIYVISARKQDGSSGYKTPEDAPLITADAGPYKIAPADPGGATVTGPGDTLSAASSGDDPGGAIDTTVDEEPLSRPTAQAPEPPTDLLPPAATMPPATVPAEPVHAPVKPVPVPAKPVPVPLPVKPVPVAAKPVPVVPKPLPVPAKPVVATVQAKPAVVQPKAAPPKLAVTLPPVEAEPEVKAEPPAPKPAKPVDVAVKPATGGGAALQLGAFSTAAKADAAWSAAVARAPYLAGLAKRIDPLERGGSTLYRLRAGGVASKAAAAELCARIRAGGDPCLVTE